MVTDYGRRCKVGKFVLILKDLSALFGKKAFLYYLRH